MQGYFRQARRGLVLARPGYSSVSAKENIFVRYQIIFFGQFNFINALLVFVLL